MSKKCNPQATCEVSEKEPKIDTTDARTYCYNISSKSGDVCLPKSCPIVKKEPQQVQQNETTETTTERSKLLPIKQPVKTCIPWDEPSKPTTSKDDGQSGIKSQMQEEGRVEPGKHIQETTSSRIPGVGQITSTSKGAPIEQQGTLDPLVAMGLGGAGMTSADGVMGVVPPVASDQSDRETVSLARLVGIAQGPAAIMASFGDTETAKESLASMGAMSMGGALVCECCECDPCVCGPRGLNMENILAALKTMMRSGDDLTKVKAALGPGAMAALGTIMGKETEAAAMWAAGGGMTSADKVESQAAKVAPAGPKETPSQIAMREAWMRGDFDEMSSCHCLPGMCPCPGGHYVYKEKKGKGKKDMLKKTKKKRIRKKVKKIGKDGKEYEEWDWVVQSETDLVSRLSETCICPPTKHFLTPASSETDASGKFVASNKRIYWGDLMVCTCPRLQRTLVIIKPESVKFKDVIFRAIKIHGLDILAEREVQLSPEEASEIYANIYGSFRFPNMVVSISQAPVVALSLGGIDVVKIWNHIIGPDGTLPGEWFLPDWIGRKFGHYGDIVDALHGSKNLFDAERENRYFFPDCCIDPVMKNGADVTEYLVKNVNPTLLKALTLLAKTRPIDPIIFLAEWLLTHNPFQPHFPNNVSLSPM